MIFFVRSWRSNAACQSLKEQLWAQIKEYLSYYADLQSFLLLTHIELLSILTQEPPHQTAETRKWAKLVQQIHRDLHGFWSPGPSVKRARMDSCHLGTTFKLAFSPVWNSCYGISVRLRSWVLLWVSWGQRSCELQRMNGRGCWWRYHKQSALHMLAQNRDRLWA